MADGAAPAVTAGKFLHADFTADGSRRAVAPFDRLETLWVNTGTLCNIECAHCYIESAPTNGRLAYLTLDELTPFLNDAATLGAREIGFTGGEPFMNPHVIEMIEASLTRGFEGLILTNGMRPMMRAPVQDGLLNLRAKFGPRLALRVSLDHFSAHRHDEERGAGSFDIALTGLLWLARRDFRISVAGRSRWGEAEADTRAGYGALFLQHGLAIDAFDPVALIIFPEMDETKDTPEITESCWGLLDKSPSSLMCASSRMIVKRKGAAAPTVVACTLIAYAEAFELGSTLADALEPVKLNHPHCSRFCVLGGARCSAKR